MSSASSTTNSKSPLETAQKIVAELDGMTHESQLLAVRFAMETLGLHLPTVSSANSQLQGNSPQTMFATAAHTKDIRTFVATKAPKTDQQFAAVVAYFYQFEAPPDQRKESIDVQTMKEAARLANRSHPPNWRFTLQNAKNAGILNAALAGGFTLSPVGENLVAITLPGNGPPGKSNGGGGKKKSKEKSQTKKSVKNKR